MAVNLSARQLREPDLVSVVSGILERTGVAPADLCLEITESVVMADAGAGLALLHALKDLGVQLAIDDFGTGYSSLAYLKRFPVDVLKIDQCFVAGLPLDAYDSAIVRAIIAVSEALNLSVVAEGVEYEAQAQALLRLGCRDAQGFLFYRPLTGPEFETALVLSTTVQNLSKADV
jgi:EAL domain-containing protein (putative c-di-GMP-specific phosphodiesterase class I)